MLDLIRTLDERSCLVTHPLQLFVVHFVLFLSYVLGHVESKHFGVGTSIATLSVSPTW